MKGQTFRRRLGFAIRGLALAVRRERSLRTQLLAAGTVLALLLLLATRPAAVWWALLLLACALVLVAELLNSALEALVDHLHPERHPAVGAAKDIAAGAVLLASVGAVAVGVAFVLQLLGG